MSFFSLKDPPKPKKGIKPELKDRHTKALDGFKASASYFSAQRKREVEDLKFVDFEEQWDPTVKTERAGNQAVNGLPPAPPRPTVVVNQLRGPIQQVANTRRAARLALEFAPKGGGSTDDTAEVFEDIVRAIQAESRASIARNWAADRAEKCGMGCYRIDTDYCAESSDPAAWNDQEIVYRRILNQAAVYPPPHAQEPDFSDGRRWYLTEDLPVEVYREEYPDSDLAIYDAGELQGVGDAQPKWVFTSGTDDGEASQTVRIAECWEVVETEKVQVELTDGTAAYEDDIPAGKAIKPQGMRRRKKTRQLLWSKLNAVEYLEEPREINGVYVPLCVTLGDEFNIDGERRWQGIVRPAKDSQLSYNVVNSARLEAIALATKAPYIGFMETIEPYLEWWKQSSVRNYFILPLKAAYDRAGNLLPFPKRNVEEPAIQAMTIAAQSAKDDVHMTTGVPPVALGQLDPHDRSGKAIAAMQGQAEIGSSGYMDNLVNITMAYEGKVIRDMIPRVLDRPGRIVPAIGVDEKRRLVMLNAPYVEGPDGVPVMVPGWMPGMPIPKEIPGPPDPQSGQPGQPIPVKYIDLRAGEYSVAPVVGKSYATRREEASAAIGNVLQVVPPELAAAIAPAWLEEQDYPGAKKIAEIAKNALPPALRAAYQDQPGQLPPQVQAQMEQLQQQNQQLTQQLQTKQAEIQAKGAVDLEKTKLQEMAESQRTDVEQQTSIQKAEIAAAASMANAQAKVDAENFRSYVDALETKLSHQLNLHMAHLDKVHEAIQQMTGHAHEAGLEALKHGHALAEGQQAADLAPPPAEPTNAG